jgi:hypothetical protein
MYPERELIRLAVHKEALRRRVGLRRIQCADAATRVVRPLVAIDRVMDIARRLPALAGWAALAAAAAAAGWRTKSLHPVLRWAPVAFGVWREARGWLAGIRRGATRSVPDPSRRGAATGAAGSGRRSTADRFL